MNSVWILTSEVNDYNQHGAYFEKVFPNKPSKEDLKEFSNDDRELEHILKGGGRRYSEESWYYLTEHKF